MSLANRITGAERAMAILRPGLRVINIRGGLTPDASSEFATIDGGQRIDRGATEDVEAFRARAREAAIALGSKVLVFGGLPGEPDD
jgi:hypothetical protein